MDDTTDPEQLKAQIRDLEQELGVLRRKEEQHRLNEHRLEALNLLQRMTGASLSEITDFALESSVALTGSSIGYVAFLNDTEDVLTMHAWSRSAMAECAMQTKPIRYPVEDTGLWGEAVRQRKPVITNNYNARNALKKGVPDGHVRLSRHMNIPIFDGRRIVMVAGVGNKSEAYDDSDIRQLTLLMQGTWHIIQRKNAREELREQKEILEGVLNAISDVINIQHTDHTIERYNQAGYEMLKQSPESVQGKKCFELLGNKGPCGGCPTLEAIRSKRPATIEKYIPELGVWLDCRSNPVIDENGKVVRIIQQLRDITGNKQAEKEKALLQEKLLVSQKMEALGTLTGGVAHDFNNILTIITGWAELLRDDIAENHPARKGLNEILAAGARAKNIVGHLLTFGRKGEFRPIPWQIGPVVREALQMMRSVTPSSVQFREAIADGLPDVVADSTQIHQLLVNLCKNAADAMHDEGGILEVAMESVFLSSEETGFDPELAPGNYLKLVVRDNGHGIPEEHLRRIFDPYFTTREVGRGTGLGLAIALGIAKRHGGSIHVESRPAKGTTVSVFFPVSDQKAVEVNPEPQDDLPTGNESVLLVDDEPSIAELNRLRMEKLGYRVTSETDPEKALGVFSAAPEHFELVVTDMTMPGMSGLRLAQKIRSMDPGAKIILCTGYSEKLSLSTAAENGIACVIQKPVDLKTLAVSARTIIDRGVCE